MQLQQIYNKLNMLFQILTTVLIILVIYIINKWYIVPKNLMKYYVSELEKRNYKVKFIPYNLSEEYYQKILIDGQKLGDSLRQFKEQYPKYDAIVTNIVNKPYIEFLHPDFIRDFYSVDKHYQYPKMQPAIQFLARIAGKGMLLSQGKQWKRKRIIFNNIFNFQFLKSQCANIEKLCQTSLQKFQKQNQVFYAENQFEYNTMDLFVQIFSRVMLTSFFGMKNQEKIEGESAALFLKKIVDDASRHGFDFLSLALGQKFWNLGLRQIDRSIKRRITLYKNWAILNIGKKTDEIQASLTQNALKKSPSDIIEAMIMQNKKNQGSAHSISKLTQSEIISEFTLFFFAGTDTTSNFTQTMICNIVANPEIQKKVRQQISNFMSKQDYSYENLKNFKYIDNVQKQITRVYGPVIYLFLRQASEDNYLNGIAIKKGTNVNIIHQGNHFSEKYFKDPQVFRPQRWENQCNDIPSYVVGGFSAGARTCIGKHLAMIQNKIAVIKFFKRYNKIEIPKNLKMSYKLFPCFESFKAKLTLNQNISEN